MRHVGSFAYATTVLLTASVWIAGSRASVVSEMTFEQVVRGASMVVVARIVESPEMGTVDPVGGVVRRHRVRIERYLKGSGPNEITVITVGGKFVRDTDHGPEVMEGTSDAAPQLPGVGSDVVLFLRPWSDGYLIYSASQGVVRVTKASDGSRSAILYFGDPAVMPDDARAEFLAAHPGSEKAIAPFPGQVRVEELPNLVRRALGLIS